MVLGFDFLGWLKLVSRTTIIVLFNCRKLFVFSLGGGERARLGVRGLFCFFYFYRFVCHRTGDKALELYAV